MLTLCVTLCKLCSPDGCRLTRRSQQIGDFPLSGRKVPEFEVDQIREVIERPYRIIYHIKSDQIDILAVIHGAEDILH